MSADLSARLRQLAKETYEDPETADAPLLLEAAAEIERLRKIEEAYREETGLIDGE